MNESNEERSRYPRVSDIIGVQTAAEMRTIPLNYLVNASLRGMKIHAYCTAYVNALAMPEIESGYEPYVEAFIGWCDENVQRPILCTTRLYDDVKRFTGEFDMIVQLKNGKRALIDLKTSASTSKSWAIQLSAYDHLCKVNGLQYDEIFVVHLKKKPLKKKKEENGQDSPLEVQANVELVKDITKYWDIFASALQCYDYFNRKEPKPKDPKP